MKVWVLRLEPKLVRDLRERRRTGGVKCLGSVQALALCSGADQELAGAGKSSAPGSKLWAMRRTLYKDGPESYQSEGGTAGLAKDRGTKQVLSTSSASGYSHSPA
jgi:hypothetical protein